MKTALIVGSGSTVRQEYALASRHEPHAGVIGVNWGGLVAEPDILFGNHARMLVERIAPDIERHWGRRRFELHTTPLEFETDYAREVGLIMWPKAYRKHVGSGVCAALAARLMGFERVVLVGCPHRGPYDAGRGAYADNRGADYDWGAGPRTAGRRNMDEGLKAVVPELKGFATSTSGMTAELLGRPAWAERIDDENHAHTI